jgi:hypothetical protein
MVKSDMNFVDLDLRGVAARAEERKLEMRVCTAGTAISISSKERVP